MDPSDNFSQKKKKDLIAIASLFGILSEEKANRMTKPELISFLVEQDRISKSSGTPSDTPPADMNSSENGSASAEVVETSDLNLKKTVAAKKRKTDDVNSSPKTKKSVQSSTESISAPQPTISPVSDTHSSGNKAEKKSSGSVTKPRKVKESSLQVTQSDNAEESPASEPQFSVDRPAIQDDQPLQTEDNSKKKKQTKTASLPESDMENSMEASKKETPKIVGKGRPSHKKSSPLPTEPLSLIEDQQATPETGSTEPTTAEITSEQASYEKSEMPDSSITLGRETESQDVMADTDTAEIKSASVNPSPDKSSGHPRTKHRSVIIKPKNEVPSPLPLDAELPEQTDIEALRDDTNGTERPHHRTERLKEQNQEILSGVLEIMQEGYGFLRRENYLQGQSDIFVAAQYIRRFNLRVGDHVSGPCRPRREAERYQALQYIKEVNGFPPEKMIRRPNFDRLTPIYPDQKYVLETEKIELSTRIIDLIAPIGKGQRGMIVSPPKAGKTILLQKIANAISINNPESKLIVLLIDERPEEVTDMQRSINGEVVFSTFDKTPENHVRITELVLERAMRLVELGQDVVILLDSITRLSRAYNLTINPTGRTLSGGLDPGALYGPKRFFGAARNIENGGSLTIIATSLIDTGSRMDEVIFEEFKGTGNMEVYLDRKLSEKRIFPAIDINKSGTRREELLLSQIELDAVWTIRKALGQLDTAAVTEMIISLLLKTTGNSQFVSSVNVSFNDKATFEAMRGTRLTGSGSAQGGAQQAGK